MKPHPIDPQIVKDLLTVIEALMPGIRYLALQDYKIINDAQVAARTWLRSLE